MHPVPSGSSSDSIDQARFTPGTMLTDRYRVVGLLGKGGMGEVYRADDLKLRQPVALKFLPVALSKDARKLERFHHEVRVARQVSHPNVCRVYDIGEAEGQHFISMEFIDGEDLASVLRRMGKPSTDKAVEIARQLCAGLAAAHDKGVLHRDLKPHNVMIDGRGKVRITDFGLAGFVEDFAGKDVAAGTPAYMAPEQLAGREVSVKSDVYSLGLVLFELFAGKRLFEGATREQIEQLRATGTTTLSGLSDDIDPTVDRVIQRCLEIEPSARPSSALAVAAALPGGNPLAAALAAGETPSPELVALAGETGSLTMRSGLILLGLFLGVFGLTAGVTTYFSRVFEAAERKAPAVLADDARDVLRALGYTDPPTDSAYGFGRVGFWYRQSPSRLVPAYPMGIVTMTDPPTTEAGMAAVVLDRRGRLRRIAVVGPQPPLNPPLERGETEGAPQPATQDETGAVFDAAFEAAGLERDSFQPAAPVGTPRVGCDRRFAWTGEVKGNAGTSVRVRVEAATLFGKPVYFERLADTSAAASAIATETESGWIAAVVRASVPIVLIGVMVGCFYFARRNLRLGRSDRRGATRLGVAVFLLTAASKLLVSEYWGTGAQVVLTLIQLLGMSLFAGVFALTLYLAVEPYVRRAWPERIVSMTRLLSGRLTDPLIGRDILIGLLIGVIANLLFLVVALAARSFGLSFGAYWSADFYDATLSMRHTLSGVLSAAGDAFGASLWVLFLLVVSLGVFRRRGLASASVVVILFLFICGFARGGDIVTVVLTGAVWTAFNSVAILRYGPLTLMAAAFAHRTTSYFAATFDFGVWNIGNIWFAHAILIGLAVFGFVTATRGQTLLKDEVFDSATRTSS